MQGFPRLCSAPKRVMSRNGLQDHRTLPQAIAGAAFSRAIWVDSSATDADAQAGAYATV